MVRSAREILNEFYDAELAFTSAPPGQGDIKVITDLLSDDYYMEQSSALPWAGVYSGKQGFQDWLEKASEWTSIDVRDRQVFEGDQPDKVMVATRVYHKGRKTGVAIDFPLAQIVTVDRQKGLIKEIRPFYWDIKRLNEAIGYKG